MKNSQGQSFTDLQKKNKITKILKEYSDGINTLGSICRSIGNISSRTFYRWIKGNAEFEKMYQDAQEDSQEAFYSLLANKARKSILKKVSGYEYEEIMVESEMIPSGKNKKVEGKETIRKTKKHVAASDSLIKFALINADKTRFQDKIVCDSTVNLENKEQDITEMLTTDQLMEMEAKMLEIQKEYTGENGNGHK